MAGHLTFRNIMHGPECTDIEELELYLQYNFNMPTVDWWAGADIEFERLRALIEQRPDKAINAEGDISTHAARVAVTPIVVLLKSGSYLAKVTATNVPLTCTAFGSISAGSYIDILWDILEKQPSISVISVSEALATFRIQTSQYIYEIRYFQCSELVRSYPDILSAPDSALSPHDEAHATVRSMHDRLREVTLLGKNRAHVAYYYARAWAISRGQFSLSAENTFESPLLTSSLVYLNLVFVILQLDKEDPEDDDTRLSKTIKLLIQRLDKYSPRVNLAFAPRISVGPFPEELALSWIELLENLQATPLHELMVFEHYLQLNVVWIGSGIRGGLWTQHIERRLKSLNLHLLKKFGAESQLQLFTWPQRLVAANNNSTKEIYEGAYVVGMKYNDDKGHLAAITQTAKDWKFEDAQEAASTGFVNIEYVPRAALRTRSFQPCTRIWQTEPITNPNLSSTSRNGRMRVQTLPKPRKIQETKSTFEPMSKLRPASDVLSRLRYDRTFNIDEFKVGYEDRHSDEPMEKPAEDWKTDTTHEDFIPEHRIMYFKQYMGNGKTQTLWDKGKRVDLIFGSGKNMT